MGESPIGILLAPDRLELCLVVDLAGGVVVLRRVARRDVERHIEAASDLVEDILLKLGVGHRGLLRLQLRHFPAAGHRPALVLSPSAYNGRVGLALLFPITNQAKGYPFEVALPEGLSITGVVGADQVKSLDWRARKASRICAVPDEVVGEVVRRLQTLLGKCG